MFREAALRAGSRVMAEVESEQENFMSQTVRRHSLSFAEAVVGLLGVLRVCGELIGHL